MSEIKIVTGSTDKFADAVGRMCGKDWIQLTADLLEGDQERYDKCFVKSIPITKALFAEVTEIYPGKDENEWDALLIQIANNILINVLFKNLGNDVDKYGFKIDELMAENAALKKRLRYAEEAVEAMRPKEGGYLVSCEAGQKHGGIRLGEVD